MKKYPKPFFFCKFRKDTHPENYFRYMMEDLQMQPISETAGNLAKTSHIGTLGAKYWAYTLDYRTGSIELLCDDDPDCAPYEWCFTAPGQANLIKRSYNGVLGRLYDPVSAEAPMFLNLEKNTKLFRYSTHATFRNDAKAIYIRNVKFQHFNPSPSIFAEFSLTYKPDYNKV